MFSLEALRELQQKPAPFAPGEPLFWNDPYISQQMLLAHLSPHTDAASRRPETIERSVAWLIDALELTPGQAVLDLGCGPGLYASRLAERGLAVAGVDFSQNSIDYAVAQARERNVQVAYRHQNYLDLNEVASYDAALLIYGDFCPLAPEKRQQLLRNIHRALKEGGRFVLDVSTRHLRARCGARADWKVMNSGFWRPGQHLVLTQGFDYPELSLYLDQYIVVESDGRMTVYRNWFQDYTRETITAELAQNGFVVQSAWSDLTGSPYSDEADWIGIIAQKYIG
ncbi:hypothetical protein U14_03471 [Candidatus Moduliflexus flocculans]|uniref:Methyltransferase domain-containing protein n=1 Tax=Candidatus Moduliflexus flocculans TaxID=1499966 RepID=A0A081BPA4_9BACT|nr:hypothetical protein U14_03471 [Candidatus Moduliflexus flocculans]